MGSELEDWQFNDSEGFYIFEPDLNLRIVREPFENNRDFEDDWVKTFPDSRASTKNHKIFYKGNFIEEINIVYVDGGRINIHFPRWDCDREEQERKNPHLTEWQYKIGRILNKDNYVMQNNVPEYERTHFEGILERAVIDYPEI